MSYKQVYAQIQGRSIHVPRNFVRDVILAVTGIQSVRVFRTTLDPTKCRGFYVPARNTNHPFVKQAGTNVIVLSRSLNRCWERFVFVKELMHILDSPADATDTGDAFELALTQLTGPGSPRLSVQTVAEINAFWMALGVLCPEPVRQQMKIDRQAGHITDYQIALQLLIPEQYVPRLFHPIYENLIFPIIN